jgi:hypothetical protein
MARRLPRSLSCVILASVGLSAGAVAAELGDARVVSHIGQQLVAEIELTALHDEAAPVQVRLASADIYRGAGIAMPPVLSALNLSVARRGGRQFLNLTSLGPVQSDYLHLYLELAEGNERSVRLATLWLTPDPKPVSQTPPEPAPVAKAVPKAEPEPKPALAFMPSPGLASAPTSALKPAPATAARAVHAAPVQAPKPTAAPVRLPVAKVAPPAPAPLPLGAAKPASCPQPDPAVLKTCVALDYKNARLTEQIGNLEDKVKVLQTAMGAAPSTVSAPSPAPHAANATARVAPHLAKPKKAAPPPEPAFPWLWLALGGALLLGAGVSALVLRGKAAREREAKAKKASLPPVMPAVKNRLMPEKGESAGAGPSANSAQE